MSKKEMKKAEKTEKIAVPVEMFACLDDKGVNYLVDIELPGVDKKDIELSMHEDLILVRAERPDQTYMAIFTFL